MLYKVFQNVSPVLLEFPLLSCLFKMSGKVQWMTVDVIGLNVD